MAEENTLSQGSFYGEAVVSLLVLIGLALPFVPLPGDKPTRIVVEYRTPAMTEPIHFAARTKRSICAALATTLSYGDPRQDDFTRVDCAAAAATTRAGRED